MNDTIRERPQKVAQSPITEPTQTPAAPSAPRPEPEGPAQVREVASRAMPARRPFGRQEYRLGNLPETPGFVPRWFNDKPGRIARAMAAGYVHITDHEGKNISLVVGKAEGGGGEIGYAMKIPKEFYDEDFAAKQAIDDRTMEMVYRGRYNAEKGDARYGGVKVTGVSGAKPRRPMGG